MKARNISRELAAFATECFLQHQMANMLVKFYGSAQQSVQKIAKKTLRHKAETL